MEILLTVDKQFTCENCNFTSKWKSDLDRHYLTAKHKNRMNFNGNKPKCKKVFKCKYCDKEYLATSGLWYHNKKCNKEIEQKYEEEIETPKIIAETPQNTIVLDSVMVLELIKQNQEFKTLILEQQNKLMEFSSKTNTTNNITNTNTNSNNKTFNLNFFLNETCKDAMNISDFIQNLNIQLQELENVGNTGYVSGISDIIVSRIKDLDVSKRPLHCTDIKRETMYIRDDNEWNKDTIEKSKLRKFIGQVAKENFKKIPEWREQNPECQDMYNQKYEYCMQLMRNSLGDLDEKQEKMDDKIIKNIAKQVAIEKDPLVLQTI
jgi:hypothetical protein